MKRMWDKEELKEIVEEYAPEFDPSTIESGDIPQEGILGITGGDELVKGNLFGKYVRILKASDLTTPLSDDTIAAIKNGAFIDGVFGGFTNAMFYPAVNRDASPNDWWGIFVGILRGSTTEFAVFAYRLDVANKSVSLDSVGSNRLISINLTGATFYRLGSSGRRVSYFNDRYVPEYPSNTGTFAFQCVNGTLTWASVINNLAPEFDSTATYAENDLVMYQGTLYACSNAAGHTGDWDAADFTRKYISEVI